MAINRDFTHRYGGQSFNLDRSALYLISIVVADKELKETYRRYSLPHLEEWIEEEKEGEVIRLLVEIATCYRLMYWNESKKPYEVVGTIQPDPSSDKCDDLSMLEACHKVIHANEIAFDVRKLRGSANYYLKPFIHLTGTKGRKKWLASVDLLLFCNAAVQPVGTPFGQKGSPARGL